MYKGSPVKPIRPKIELLADPLIDQIAAGEVIERPASVVKELVENSLDAQSAHIEVNLENGGKNLIQVIDDGHGIDSEDLPLAIVSHATSKIRQADDLRAILTRGFRGEALASMGAVGCLEISSRVAQEDSGWSVEVDQGQVSQLRPVAMTQGTRVSLRSLFGHLPARRKFLKSSQVEISRCQEILNKLALSSPKTHIILKVDGRVRTQWSPAQELSQRVSQVLGVEDVREGGFDHDGIKVTVCLAPPVVARQNRSAQYLFILDRPIKDRALSQTIWQTTREFIPDNRHAALAAFIDLDPTRVDVNVHPTKEEVRLEKPRQVASALAQAIRQAVLDADYSVSVLPQRSQMQVMESKPQYTSVPRAQRAVKENWQAPGLLGFTEENKEAEEDKKQAAPPRTFMQIHNAYIVVETDEGLSILDQHALHERVLLQRLRRGLLEGQIEKQPLLIPQLVEILPAEASILLDLRPDLAAVGLDIEDHGDGVLAVSAVPAMMAPESVTKILQDFVEKSDGLADSQAIRLALARICACRSAVKAGDHLKKEEIESLLQDFTEEDYTFACEHGRPTHIRLTLAQLARGFSRH